MTGQSVVEPSSDANPLQANADTGIDLDALRERYRQRRELANFYQAQITALNTAPVQAWATIPLFVSIAALLISTGEYPKPLYLTIILTAIVIGGQHPRDIEMEARQRS